MAVRGSIFKDQQQNKCDVLIYPQRNIHNRPACLCSLRASVIRPVCRSPTCSYQIGSVGSRCCTPAVIRGAPGGGWPELNCRNSSVYYNKNSLFLISWRPFWMCSCCVHVSFCSNPSPQQCVFLPLRGNWPPGSVS